MVDFAADSRKRVGSMSGRPLGWNILRAAALLLTLLPQPQPAPAALLPIAGRRGAVSLVVSGDEALAPATARWCQDFLRKRGFPAGVARSLDIAETASDLWLLETEAHCPAAHALGIDVSGLASGRADAYLLGVSEKDGRAVVSIVGKDVVGLRSGVARLVASCRQQQGELLAPLSSGVHSPFFPVRELVVANRGLVLQNTPYADTLWRNWSDERIGTYAEQLWLLGFNSLQVGEGRSFRITPETEARALEVARKLWLLSEAAHTNGLRVSQLIWGQAPFNRKICWNAPETRAVMESEFRWMARTYAAKVDHVVLHMRDPGGCNCGVCDDYKTPQEIAAFVFNEYRKSNPRVTLTLSTWMNRTFWAYAPGPRFLTDTSVQFFTGDPAMPFPDNQAVRLLPGAPVTRFLDATTCPLEIGIALHKWYSPEKAALVLQSRRAVDIWSWYICDQETTTDMSLCQHRLDSYFRSLPDRASEDIRRISTELCFHGWPQVINAHISAQKMWSPHRDLGEIEREFCAGMFGETNAEAMVQLYEACELLVNPKRSDTCLPAFDKVFGNPEYNQRFRAALNAGSKVVLHASPPPRFTTATDPQQLLDYLLRHLKLVTTLSETQEELNRAKQAGAERSKLEGLVTKAVYNSEPFVSELLYPPLMERLRASVQPPRAQQK
jgi:hypothetical protein